jgi:hypothetical protein
MDVAFRYAAQRRSQTGDLFFDEPNRLFSLVLEPMR